MSIKSDPQWKALEKYICPQWNSGIQGKTTFARVFQYLKNFLNIVGAKCNRAWHRCFSKDHEMITNDNAKQYAIEKIPKVVYKNPENFQKKLLNGLSKIDAENAISEVKEISQRLKELGADLEAFEIDMRIRMFEHDLETI